VCDRLTFSVTSQLARAPCMRYVSKIGPSAPLQDLHLHRTARHRQKEKKKKSGHTSIPQARVPLELTASQSVSQSVSSSWRRAHFGTHDQLLMCCQTITGLVVMERPP
jgi:hypothetical protein